jgi:two-component system cell cycle sensor histidine kinase/response regulator CckA
VDTGDGDERAALEEELARSNERLKIALSAARALCWDRDYGGKGAWYSSDLRDYYHLPIPNDGADTMAAVVHPEDRAAVQRAVQESLASGTEFQVEFRANDGGARPRVYATRGAAFRDPSGVVTRISGITWDITETRRLQNERLDLERKMQESQKLESLGVLAGGIAHDFNNILATILGNATLMMEAYDADPSARSYLEPIAEAALRAGELCKQMLAYAGKGALAPADVDVNALVVETTSLLKISMSKKAELLFELAPELPKVSADATQLRQVFMNLVINASDAIGDRPGTVTLRTNLVHLDGEATPSEFSLTELPDGEYVCIGVTDTGSGMSEETVQRIFEPFFSTKGLGRGLGLAAVLGIVRAHAGALRVKSEPGRGTTFVVLLPSARRRSPARG